MDSLKGWEQRLEVWFGKYFLNSQRGPQHCIFLSSLIEKYQNKELDRFVSFLWVPVEKKNSFSFTQFEVTAILRLFTETSVWCKELDRFVSFLWVPVEKKTLFHSHSSKLQPFYGSLQKLQSGARNWIGSCLFSGFQLKKKLFFIHTVRSYGHSTALYRNFSHK